MNTEERLVSYQVNECLKQRDKLRAEVERLRAATVDDPACSDPMCSYRAEALTRGAMPTLTLGEANVLLFETEDVWRKTDADADPVLYRARAKLSLIANGENDG